MSRSNPSAPLVAVAGWLVPGLGYVMVGERARGLVSGATILLTLLAGLMIGGIRVIDVPGYDAAGHRKMVAVGRFGNGAAWALGATPRDEVLNKPWYIAQCLTGAAIVPATWGSLAAADAGHPMSTARVFDIGTLYTAVAGMLNLLAVLDATYRATRPSPPKSPGFIVSAAGDKALQAIDQKIVADAAVVSGAAQKTRDETAGISP